MRRLLAAAAVMVAAAGAVVLPTESPATAAACSGVTVRVDFNQLGGGTQQVCDADGGGKKAAEVFTESGFALTRVQSEPGFVCRVNDQPQDSCARTPPSNRYWALYSASGGGQLAYSSQGVDSLTVEDGDTVAFIWTQSDATTAPAAPTRTAGAKPTSRATHTSGSAPTSAAPTAVSTPTSTSTPTAASTTAAPSAAHRHRHPSHAPSPKATRSGATSSPSATPATTVAEPPAASGSGGLPGWVPPVIVAALVVAAGAVALLRRRRT